MTILTAIDANIWFWQRTCLSIKGFREQALSKEEFQARQKERNADLRQTTRALWKGKALASMWAPDVADMLEQLERELRRWTEISRVKSATKSIGS